MLDEAAGFVGALRPEGDARRAISVSFRAAPELLAFVNDVFEAIDKAPERHDAFRYGDADQFPVEAGDDEHAPSPLGLIVAGAVSSAADRVADRDRRPPRRRRDWSAIGTPA